MRFEKGDIVKLITYKWGDEPFEPVWGGDQGYIEGEVTGVDKNVDYPVNVDWDNGESETYAHEDLALVNGLKFKIVRRCKIS